VACSAVRSWPHEFVEREGSRIAHREADFDHTVMVHDTATGRMQTIGADLGGNVYFRNWLDGSHVLLDGRGWQDYVACSTETPAAEPLALPEPDQPASGSFWYDAMHLRYDSLYRHRLYFTRRLERAALRLAVYSLRTKRWRLRTIPQPVDILDVSADGNLALTEISDWERKQKTVQLLSLENESIVSLHTSTDDRSPCKSAAFSPDGRYVLLATGNKYSRGADRVTSRLYDIAAGCWRMVSDDVALRYPEPTFTPDGSRILWGKTSQIPGYDDSPSLPRFHVYDIATAQLRPLPIRRTSLLPPGPNSHALHDGGIYFTCGGAAIYHIRLDGTGLERVFPRKQALTVAEFEAEAGR
jgi:WD40 repeat protein